MSGATYRIDLIHDATTATDYKWDATVYDLADEKYVGAVYGKTPDEATDKAREMIRRATASLSGYSLYVGDDGQDAEAPHSVKV